MGALLSSLYALSQVVSTLQPFVKATRVLWLFALVPLYIITFDSTATMPQGIFSTGAAWQSHGVKNGITTEHPIKKLVEDANARHAALIQSQSQTLQQAVAEYRRRYHRSPPRGFDVWFGLAKAHDVTIIDDYDTLTNSFAPYWNVPPSQLRKNILSLAEKRDRVYDIKIRDRAITTSSSPHFMLFDTLVGLLEPFMSALPESLQVPMITNRFDNMDLPRVLIPFENREALKKGLDVQPPSVAASNDFQWIKLSGRYTWNESMTSCPPSSPSLQHPSEASLSKDITFLSDITNSKDICLHPELKTKHGAWSPQSDHAYFVTHDPVPIFSVSKLSTHHDILLPSPYYHDDRGKPASLADDQPWHTKQPYLYWSGSTTGLRIEEDTEWRTVPSHRRRFVEFSNDMPTPRNVTVLERQDTYLFTGLASNQSHGPWVSRRVPFASQSHLYNVSFTKAVQCAEKACDAEAAYYHMGQTRHATKAYLSYRFVFDLDGNAFSGRFHRLLAANATVFKQTLFQEAHDDKLVPWVHYVPVSMGMEELPEMLRYFTEDREGEAIAANIARQGMEWSARALRREDTAAGIVRAILEYARLMDDKREEMTCC